MINRKFSIIQKIDVTILNNMIHEYQRCTGEINPYLFMNKNTFDAIPIVNADFYNLSQFRAKLNGITGYYHGCKVFRDDTLDFGEVEIR